jgi:hypothetical protein
VSDKRYPLSWPVGWPRTPVYRRTGATFGQRASDGFSKAKVTMLKAIARLQGELDRLGAGSVVLSTNIELRLDGLPRADRSRPMDSGVAVYFQLKGRDVALACDRWDRVEDNIVALAKHIEALRGMDRWGVGSVEQAFRGYEALPAPKNWWEVLGLAGPTGSRDDINAAWRRASSSAHPDRPGGSHDRMAEVNRARDQALEELSC